MLVLVLVPLLQLPSCGTRLLASAAADIAIAAATSATVI
jgi:hypothetical protein